MKQIIPYTFRYSLNDVSITKRRKTLTTIIRLLLLAFVIGSCSEMTFAQNCPTSGTHTQTTNENTYYPGTQPSVAAGATTITLGAAGAGTNFGATPIAIGDIVLIIQMQGAQINSTNGSLYGDGSGNGNGYLNTNLYAGNMEFVVAANAVPLAGGTLNLVTGTAKAYKNAAFATDGQYTYQLIRVPTFYNITLNASITTAVWNGSTGGVTVINAVNQMNFNSKTISAVGAGFRGGAGRQLSGAAGTSKLDFAKLSSINANGSKGEGIAGTPRYINNVGAFLDNTLEGYPNGSSCKGAPGNAGGGATDSRPASNDQNAGGGGGGNGGAGGEGGWGWQSLGRTGGRGGGTFVANASPARLILGGGGGAGTSNNGTGAPGSGFASSGSAGGGLVLISATSITGTGTINVSGANANNTVTNDASGGGGAGGSILIYANSGHSGITAKAEGGDGGSNNPLATGATRHGPGGGGGGGIIYSNAALNVASSVAPGSRGLSTGTDATDDFGSYDGNVGVLTQTVPFAQIPPNMQKCQITILPVTILSFAASYQSATNTSVVSWSTTHEINSYYYEVERSTDAINFLNIGQINASQSNELIHNYSYHDYLSSVNASVIYYRLKMVDIDGHFAYSKVVAINLDQTDTKLSIYPNPASDYAVLKLYSENQSVAILRVMDGSGKQLKYRSINLNKGNNSVMIDQLGSLPKGMYVVQVVVNNNLYNQKLIKQ